MKNLFILNFDDLKKEDLDLFSLENYNVEIFKDSKLLFEKLKKSDNEIVFILQKNHNDSFIIKVSEEKLFNHSYFLFTGNILDEHQKNLSLSLGYSSINNYPYTENLEKLIEQNQLKHSRIA